jgi:hypothetical protein
MSKHPKALSIRTGGLRRLTLGVISDTETYKRKEGCQFEMGPFAHVHPPDDVQTAIE